MNWLPHGPNSLAVILMGLLLTIDGCGPGPAPSRQGSLSPEREGRRPNLLRIALAEDVPQLSQRLGNTVSTVNPLVNGYLARTDGNGVVWPDLLERLPSRDDGTWLVNPDGTMKTILTLRPGLKWQDGQPLTAADIAFAFKVYRDRDIPLDNDRPERFISEVSARDDRTAEVSWRQPYAEAGAPKEGDLNPLPRHLLEDLYTRDKQAFINSSFWTSEEYVGAGPYRLIRRDHGVSLTLAANPHFVWGQPGIDIIEAKIIPDKNAIVARLLSGDLDFAEYSDITEQHASVLREQWKANNAGQVYTALFKNRNLEFQQRDVPNHQKAVTDMRVRRALMHAIDREALAQAETGGLSTAADSFFSRSSPLWPRIEAAITRYPYDLRQTEALLNQAGWSRGSDGMYRGAAGQTLDVEVISTPDHPNEPVIIADQWKRGGINGKPVAMPEALKEDNEYRVSFPGTSVASGTPGSYDSQTSVELPTPERRYRGRNRGSYVNPEVDALNERFKIAIDPAERDHLTVELERLISADVAVGHLYYQVRPAAGRSGLQGVKSLSVGGSSSYLWNVWEWRLE